MATKQTRSEQAAPGAGLAAGQVEIELNAAIIAVLDNEPVVLAVKAEPAARDLTDSLPCGPFAPLEHRTFEIGLRSWVDEQTGVDLGYVEQLYTFGDRGRQAQPDDTQPHIVSIGYLALAFADRAKVPSKSVWRSWYEYFPWENWRDGKPAILSEVIEPRLGEWARQPETKPSSERPVDRKQRLRICFGLDGGHWDEEKVLDRYELLYEAGLLFEAQRDGRDAANQWPEQVRLGRAMHHDHRRILATAISRIRAKIKYRPVIFELMSPEFTLFELQKTVEAILGPHLHKQNFRRLVESAGLVEPTGEVRSRTGGRPAKLFRFRREVLLERPAPGVRVKSGRM
jgi:hypothetical protein